MYIGRFIQLERLIRFNFSSSIYKISLSPEKHCNLFKLYYRYLELGTKNCPLTVL